MSRGGKYTNNYLNNYPNNYLNNYPNNYPSFWQEMLWVYHTKHCSIGLVLVGMVKLLIHQSAFFVQVGGR